MAMTQTHYQSAFGLLRAKYYDVEPRRLGFAEIVEIIKLGDFFIDEHLGRVLSTFQQENTGYSIWHTANIENPSEDAPPARQLLRTLRCAKMLEKRSACDVLRLRFARILLHRYFLQLCTTSNYVGKSRGRSAASFVIDHILTEIYGPRSDDWSPRMKQQHRTSLLRHKRVGKRWTMLARFLGSGILLICSKEADVHMSVPWLA